VLRPLRRQLQQHRTYIPWVIIAAG
jgi:hypothetical protein